MKILVAIAFILILASLGSALYYMMRQKGKNDQRMVRSLAMRVGFSIALFIIILVANKLGYIQPTGIR
ncbi:twin transmembrane helix small protein [Pseudoduganella aquatica]|jgi:formate/nitrite transporter FocA (FNT family)|uniref:Twin transmembrane helix small protein n=1 Tax=Pseudoduganella aquatica TaxID=2660641 RepID=A0A7X4H9Q6_9BURK|nr:twin transmembrane helix small protein [Pseudoduganella aquatica]MYN07251.1 twin transmembrane helix small protein [Pseudoduganella aquatica]